MLSTQEVFHITCHCPCDDCHYSKYCKHECIYFKKYCQTESPAKRKQLLTAFKAEWRDTA